MLLRYYDLATLDGRSRKQETESAGERLGAYGRTDPAQLRRYDIFEGTEQIQQLVIARAISGIRIE